MLRFALNAAAAVVVLFCSFSSTAFLYPIKNGAKHSSACLERVYIAKFPTMIYFNRGGSNFNHAIVRRPEKVEQRSPVELSYRTTDDNNANFDEAARADAVAMTSDLKGKHQKLSVDQENSTIGVLRASLDYLETQQNEIKPKMTELEYGARQVEREILRDRGSLDIMKKIHLEAAPSNTLGRSFIATELGSNKLVMPHILDKKRRGDVFKDSGVKSSDEDKAFTLTGETIADGRYLLAGKPKKSSSGRSFICTAYRTGEWPAGDALAIKISSDLEAMKREHSNYAVLSKNNLHGFFVEQTDFFPVDGEFIKVGSESIPIRRNSALVMERGKMDLKEYLTQLGHGMKGGALRDAGLLSLNCLKSLFDSKLVWTDLKAQNFVVFDKKGSEEMTIKGIDLESAVHVKGHPIDYTPETCPPEFAYASFLGRASHFVLDHTWDIWSFGMLMYELSTGEGFYDEKSRRYIMRMLGGMLPGFKPTLTHISDPNLADLIDCCLQSDPKNRPSLYDISNHPYFAN